jgi:hypothetical protein
LQQALTAKPTENNRHSSKHNDRKQRFSHAA